MNYLNEIKNFIITEENNGALLISGKWGCGKTHLIKDLQTEYNKLEADVKCAIVIISLFGIDKIETLDEEIKKSTLNIIIQQGDDDKFIEPVKKIGKIGKALIEKFSDDSKIASGLEKIMSINYFDFMELNDYITFQGETAHRKLVLVFDDFERCKIDSDLLLGVINDYCENKNIKTIIIANEERLYDNNRYKEFKEKAIFRTLKLTSESFNMNEVVCSLIDNYKQCVDGYVDFLSENKSTLISAFQDSNCQNFRTVKSVLINFERIYELWRKSPTALSDLTELLYSYFAVTAEYNDGNYIKMRKYGIYCLKGNANDDKNSKIKEKYREGIFEKFPNCLAQIIVDGEFDDKEISNYVSNKYSNPIISDDILLLNTYFWELTDEIIIKGFPVAIQKAYDGKLSCDLLISFLKLIHQLKERNVNTGCIVDYEKINSGFDKRIKRIKKHEIEEPQKRTFVQADQIDDEAIPINKKIESLEDMKFAWKNYALLSEYLRKSGELSVNALKNMEIDEFDVELRDLFLNYYTHSDNKARHEISVIILKLILDSSLYSTNESIITSIRNLQYIKEHCEKLYPEDDHSFSNSCNKEFLALLTQKIEKLKENIA